MKSVISASRRTDLPAFYMDWFSEAIRAGKIMVQNPVYKQQRFEVDLRPGNVEWIVFWSRNYQRFLRQCEIFSDYNLYFHFTIVSHHPQLERTHLPVEQALKQIEKLAHHYGPQRIIWRYDPIVVWEEGGTVCTNYNAEEFIFLCSRLSKINIRKCYFSFVTPYKKFERRFLKQYPEGKLCFSGSSIHRRILDDIKEEANRYGMELFSCCNDQLIDAQIKKGHCIPGDVLNRLGGESGVSTAKAPTRKDCGCTKSIDIGDYIQQPCYFGCIYCYANPVI